MELILTVVHVTVCLFIIGLVLIQRGKGTDMGASFGAGASQTVFGSEGSAGFLTKATGWCAAIFFVSCLIMTYSANLAMRPSLSPTLQKAASGTVPVVQDEALSGLPVE